MPEETPHILSNLPGKLVVIDGPRVGVCFDGRAYHSRLQGRVLAVWSGGRDGIRMLVQPEGLDEYSVDLSDEAMFEVPATACRVIRIEDLNDPYRRRFEGILPTAE